MTYPERYLHATPCGYAQKLLKKSNTFKVFMEWKKLSKDVYFFIAKVSKLKCTVGVGGIYKGNLIKL